MLPLYCKIANALLLLIELKQYAVMLDIGHSRTNSVLQRVYVGFTVVRVVLTERATKVISAPISTIPFIIGA